MTLPPADSEFLERERLREAIRGEEFERLQTLIDDPLRRRTAADAFADLLELFASADAAESRYDADPTDGTALDVAVASTHRPRAASRWPSLPSDRRVITTVQAARLLRERYERGGAPEDLEQAIALAEEATADARADVPSQLSAALKALGAHLTAAFDADASRRKVIDDAVSALREAVTHGRPGTDPPPSGSTRTLAAALLMRAKAVGTTEDLDDAVTMLESLPEHERDHRETLYYLGTTLIYRAELLASVSDLDRAVAALEQAGDGAPPARLPWYQASLAVALRQRFRMRGEQEDARQAARVNEEALAGIPEGAPDRLSIVQSANAGTASHDGSPEALVAQARALVAATPSSARALPARLGALAGRLTDAFSVTLRRSLLDESIATSERALSLVDPGSVDRPSLLDGLAQALTLRYAVDGDDMALGRAIDHAQAAHASAATGSMELVESAFTLARAYSLRAARSGAESDLQRTTTAFALAVELGRDRAPGAALRAGQAWGSWATEELRWPEAAGALRGALDATDQLYRRQLMRRDREAWLELAPDLPAAAAVASATAGNAKAAVLALETGRARMLSDALDRDRADLDALARGDAESLAARFRAAAAHLTLLERSELEHLHG